MVAIARYYFLSVTAAVVPILNATNSGSDAMSKVVVAHLCSLMEKFKSKSPQLAHICVPAELSAKPIAIVR